MAKLERICILRCFIHSLLPFGITIQHPSCITCRFKCLVFHIINGNWIYVSSLASGHLLFISNHSVSVHVYQMQKFAKQLHMQRGVRDCEAQRSDYQALCCLS